MTFLQFSNRFPTETDTINYFIKACYQDKVTCPHCGADKGLYHIIPRPKYFICTSCNNSFSIFSNTIFSQTKLDLRKWFYAINIFLNDKKGVSACNLQREIGVTYKTAWRVLQQIRAAMGNLDNEYLFSSIVEVDETYIGGKPRYHNPDTKRGRGTSKTPVVGIIERESKQVYAQVMLPNEEGQTLSGKQLHAFIEQKVRKESTVMTDTFPGYKGLGKTYNHQTVNHSIGEFKRGINIHTNTIESFWGLAKRSVIGVYHQVSKKYLQRYVNEWAYRANNRHNPAIFEQLLKQSVIATANKAWVVA